VIVHEPLVPTPPAHAPDEPVAVQALLFAFVDDHVRFIDWPSVIDVGLAEIVTVGAGVATDAAGFTVTVTDAGLLVPPEPVQVAI
jgi:hypothetical protein